MSLAQSATRTIDGGSAARGQALNVGRPTMMAASIVPLRRGSLRWGCGLVAPRHARIRARAILTTPTPIANSQPLFRMFGIWVVVGVCSSRTWSPGSLDGFLFTHRLTIRLRVFGQTKGRALQSFGAATFKPSHGLTRVAVAFLPDATSSSRRTSDDGACAAGWRGACPCRRAGVKAPSPRRGYTTSVLDRRRAHRTLYFTYFAPPKGERARGQSSSSTRGVDASVHRGRRSTSDEWWRGRVSARTTCVSRSRNLTTAERRIVCARRDANPERRSSSMPDLDGIENRDFTTTRISTATHRRVLRHQQGRGDPEGNPGLRGQCARQPFSHVLKDPEAPR